MPISHAYSNRNYLKTICFFLLFSLHAKQSYAEAASNLNSLNIPTPTGLQWEASHIKNLLKKIRNPEKYICAFREELDLSIQEGIFSEIYSQPLINFKK